MAGAMPEHNLLTPDYWQAGVSHEGKTIPRGTIGCEALNISDVLREKPENAPPRFSTTKSAHARGEAAEIRCCAV